MVALKIQQEFHERKIREAANKGAITNIGHAAASLRKDAVSSIFRSRGASAPGSPPHTARGLLRRAIRFDVDKINQTAVIGPMASIAGTVGAAHEFGGSYKGTTFDERPFMFPALERIVPRFAGSFKGSIGQ